MRYSYQLNRHSAMLERHSVMLKRSSAILKRSSAVLLRYFALTSLVIAPLLGISQCKSASPEPYLTENSVFFIGDFEVSRLPDEAFVEIIASGVGWQGFQSNHFTLQLRISQGSVSMYRERELKPVDQPHGMENRVIFLAPIRDVTWGLRGTPRERMNLSRDYDVCLALKESRSEATLAQQCYSVSEQTVKPTGGQRVRLEAFSPGPASREEPAANEQKPDGLPAGIPGTYIATAPLPGVGTGVLILKPRGVSWTPADSSPEIEGTWELQGKAILIRWNDAKGGLTLLPSGGGFEEVTSGVKLRLVD